MARRSRAKCGGEFTRNKSSNQEPQAIRAMRMVATQAGNTMIWMMVASLARVISTLPTMSKLLRCQAARASGGAGGDDTAGAGASLTGRRSDEVWRVAMRAVTTAAETERRLVPRAIGPIGGETQSITVVKNLLRWLMLGRFGCACKRAGKRLRGCFRRKHGVKGGAAGSYADGERNADGGDSRGRCDDVDDGGVAGAGGEVLLWLFIVKLLSGEAARAAMKIR
ncbi:hypothetical protein PC129_g10907 [Phytophthora cactorum]|uniref:Uncharacterized protein n=1 Tax=Phytophthora cactorum TaxID=29920 RepID=A0A8T0YY72_9STRA|nr:hypothetical protein PC112_g19098 [Phytophthora cactorum]KAG2804537.1 hypothetical protein PC111_g18210 [Phytophthora cactorum]KAG2854671.1 hypothetical protein PC113_g13100 [Phytophthora cactorum]KAG2909147.1 hypothetical protein PC115_g13362 [Phytophthora cactorum]KAG2917766.1 hypothetical protein PC114_g7032 [Phytophthora cactorum]